MTLNGCQWVLHVLTLMLAGATQAEYLSISPEVSNNIAETESRTLQLRFLNCSNDVRRDVSISLIKGWERNLDFPPQVYNVPCVTDSSNISSVLGANVTITGRMIGFVTLEMRDMKTDYARDYAVGIIRPPEQIQDDIYLYGLMIFVVVNTCCFGISLDLTKVKGYLKKPIAPCIGMGCQYILLPLLGFLAAVLITTHNAEKFGVFACAVAPGGGLSNIWTFATMGDLDLSITMTAISTVAALAFLPLWLYTLGEYILKDEESNIELPFTNMAITLALLVIPLSIGMLINRFLPKVGKAALKWVQKPSMTLTIIFGVVMNVWANIYAFKLVLFNWQLALCSFLLPYAGGLVSFIIGLIFRQNRKISMTIGIEVAIQNTSISTILLRTSLPQPWADISSAIPISMIIFTFVPFPFVMAAQQIYLRCIKKNKDGKLSKHEDSSEMESDTNEKGDKLQGRDNPAAVTDDTI